MKLQNFLLVALFAIFVIQVQAHGDYDEYKEWEHDLPDNCEELFNITYCSKCQELIWDRFQNPGPCATVYNLAHEIIKAVKDSGETPKPYDLKFFKEGLTSYCHKGFYCSQNQAEKIYKEIEDVCYQELSVVFDWSADPKTYKDITAYLAYGTLLIYYTGIPSREALCLKSDYGDFCSYEFSVKFIDWMKKATYADPKAIVSHDHKYVIKGNGERIPIPESFQCDKCWRKMAKIYIDYVNEHKLKKSIEDNIWGSDHNTELPECSYKRGLGEILGRERSVSNLNKRSAIPTYGILNPRKLHPFAI